MRDRFFAGADPETSWLGDAADFDDLLPEGALICRNQVMV